MASTIYSPIGEKLKAIAEGLDLTPALTGYWTSPGLEGMKAPACVVGVPELRRTQVGDSESQLSTDDWFLEYPLEFAIDLDNAPLRQAYLAEAVEAFIKAIDADDQLSGLTLTGAQILEVAVNDVTGIVDRRELARPMLTVMATASVWVLRSS